MRLILRRAIVNALILNCSPVKTGATAGLVRLAAEKLSARYSVRTACIADYDVHFCLGCRACHKTGRCVQEDGVQALMAQIDAADVLLCVSPSYWADVPGQFKAFIDRCTPWCNTHEPHARLAPGKKGYAIALRTGPGMKECERILDTLAHFYGHLEISTVGRLGLTQVEYKEHLTEHLAEINRFLDEI